MNAPALSLDTAPSVLSPRERQVLIALAQGYTNREIAAAMLPSPISVKTIDTHRGHALKKLGLRCNADLTRYAIYHLLVDHDGRELTDTDRAKMVVMMPTPLDSESVASAA